MTMARRLAALAGAVAALAARAHAVTYAATAVTQYSIQTPDIGGCRLKGIATDSDNFKFYASLPAKDVAINQGCARCIKVSRDGVAASLTAYVLDVCQGCKTGEIKLSAAALSALSIDPNSNNATASYKFASCPTSFQSGTTVRACLMEGASNSYIPLQFYNSQKVIVGANISGVAASQQKDSFFFSANPQTASSNSSQWFKNVQVTLTSDDGETKSGSFEFGGTSGCAASTFQFSAASTADGEGGNSSGGSGGASSSSNTGVIVGAIAGGIAALIVIVGSVFFLRRRRAAKEFDREEEQDNQYLSPTTKPHQRSPERPTYAADNSLHNSTDDPSDHEPESPTHEFDDASTPPASAANRNVYGAREVEQYELRDVPPQPPQRSQSPPQRSQSPPQRSQSPPQRSQSPPQPQPVAPPAANQQTYVAPQTFSYSKPVTNERLPKNNSFRSNSTARPVPTFQAPVVPARTADSDGEEGRSSFDIDDMRETEEMKDRERFSSMSNELQSSVAPHSSESAYATGHVTSPQSYVRATSLRRNSSKVADRPTFRFTSPAPAPQQQDRYNSDSLGQYSDRDSYASDNFSRSESIDTAANVNPHTGSFRDSSSGYSRESLGILGYPYAKKPSSRNSMTGTNLA